MDRKYWGPPEPGFSVERNMQVIENSIKKYEARRAKKMREFEKALGERTDAAATYLTGMGGAERSRSVEKYFGKQYLAHLRADDIRTQLIKQRMMQIGNDKEKVWKEKQNLKNLVANAQKIKIKRTKTDGEKK